LSIRADVIIVGAGPAGAMAAISSGGSGERVVLLDKEQFPRDKPCGGGISYRVLARFPDIADYIRQNVPINYIHKVLLESPAGEQVLTETQNPLYLMIRRYEFDNALVDLAKAKGVDVVQNARAT
jgi:flavin-dependent dehydrogenase